MRTGSVEERYAYTLKFFKQWVGWRWEDLMFRVSRKSAGQPMMGGVR